jgi:hypothetical protein
MRKTCLGCETCSFVLAVGVLGVVACGTAPSDTTFPTSTVSSTQSAMMVAPAPEAVLECRANEHIEVVACPNFELTKTMAKVTACSHTTPTRNLFGPTDWSATVTVSYRCSALLEVPEANERKPCEKPTKEGNDPNAPREEAECATKKAVKFFETTEDLGFSAKGSGDEVGADLEAKVTTWCEENGLDYARTVCDRKAEEWALTELPKPDGVRKNPGTLCCVDAPVVLTPDPFLVDESHIE